MTVRQASIASCALACVALALIIFIGARVAAAPTRGAILVDGQDRNPAPAPAPTATACTLPAGVGVTLGGACRGAVGGFSCVAVTDDLYLSARRPIDSEHVLYLTVNVESYRHRPGDYAGVQAFLQVTGPAAVPTWSARGFTAHVDAPGDVDLAVQSLTPDPGTGSSGTVSVSGTARCLP